MVPAQTAAASEEDLYFNYWELLGAVSKEQAHVYQTHFYRSGAFAGCVLVRAARDHCKVTIPENCIWIWIAVTWNVGSLYVVLHGFTGQQLTEHQSVFGHLAPSGNSE